MSKIKILLLLFGIFLFYTCNPKTWYGHLDVYIKNYTDKYLFIKIEAYTRAWSTVETSESFISSKDSIILSYNAVGNYYNYPGISINNIKLYNLSDTMFLEFTYENLQNKNNNDILKNIWYVISEQKFPKVNGTDSLIITSEILTLFQKDTSMLTKFKDYYNP